MEEQTRVPGVNIGEHGRVDSGKPEHIMQFFAYEHLPPHLQVVSKPFGDLARQLVGDPSAPPPDTGWIPGGLPRSPERTVALRKLLEAKDAAVRAIIAKEV
jgi:hypothetical protein